MLFSFYMLDDPATTHLRASVRPEHKKHLAKVADQISFAGPLLADDGKTMIGSLLVIDFASREDAQAWLSEEPFTRAGIYGRTEVLLVENLWPQKAGVVK